MGVPTRNTTAPLKIKSNRGIFHRRIDRSSSKFKIWLDFAVVPCWPHGKARGMPRTVPSTDWSLWGSFPALPHGILVAHHGIVLVTREGPGPAVVASFLSHGKVCGMPRTVPPTEWSFVGSFPAPATRRGAEPAR